jgi:hypothetical protein
MPWTRTVLSLVDASAEHLLRGCDWLFTVSTPLADVLAAYGAPVPVFPNYRRGAISTRSGKLRRLLSLREDDLVLTAACMITSGLEDMLLAMSQMTVDAHLVVIGRVKPDAYLEAVRSLVSELAGC